MHLQKRLVVFGDKQDALSPVPALLHRVEERRALWEVDDPYVLVLAQQLPDGLGLVRRGPVDYHGHLSEMPLHLPQVPDECWRIELLVGAEELPAVRGYRAVRGDLLVAPRVRNPYRAAHRGPVSMWELYKECGVFRTGL